ncbi:hypothetical protein ACLKA6_011997 [Drosophila palustris]
MHRSRLVRYEPTEADGIILGSRDGHSAIYPRRPHGSTRTQHSPYDSEDSLATPPRPGVGPMLPTRPKEEYEEVLAAADGVDLDLGEDLPLDQLDWMKAPEGWFLNGLPRAALRTIKFLVETEGKTFQIKMSYAGRITVSFQITWQRCGSQKDPLATLAGQKEITWQHCGSQKDPLATLAGQREITWQRCGSQKDPLATLACKRVGNIAGSRKSKSTSTKARESCGVVVCHKTNGDSKFECGRALPSEPYNSHDNHSSAPAPTESAYRAWIPPQRPQQRTSANPECVWSLAPASTAATSTHSPRARGQRRRLFHHVYTWAAVKKRKSGLKRNGAYKLCSS